MKHEMEKTRLDKPIPEQEIFSRNERFIARCGLCAAIPTAALYGLCLMFPNHPQIAAMFAAIGALTLFTASLCILAKPSEVTANAAKKLAKRSLIYAGRVSAGLRAAQYLFAYVPNRQRHTCRVRTNARARRHASRPTFAHASCSSGDKDSDDGVPDQSDQGDPPGFSHHHTVTFSSLSDKKLNSPSGQRHPSLLPDCWPMPWNRYGGSRRCAA
jgi:hypothetical protein